MVNITLTLADSAGALMGDETVLSTGTFRPTNVGADASFLAPAPPVPYQSPAPAGAATFASAFGGASNGIWSLYVRDQFAGDFGQFAGGWSLTFNTEISSCAVVNSPTITNESASPSSLSPPNHRMVNVLVSYNTSDCVECTLSVSSNEPINGPGDGNTDPDYEVLGPNNVRLRAERAAGGTGRIYTITITCFNGVGTAVRTVTVLVPHDSNAVLALPDDFWGIGGRLHGEGFGR